MSNIIITKYVYIFFRSVKEYNKKKRKNLTKCYNKKHVYNDPDYLVKLQTDITNT